MSVVVAMVVAMVVVLVVLVVVLVLVVLVVLVSRERSEGGVYIVWSVCVLGGYTARVFQ